MSYQLLYIVNLWNRIKMYSDTLATGFTTLQDTDFCPVTNTEGKASFHHHRKILILIFTWGGVSVCPLCKVGAFYTIFLSPRADCLFLQMLWMVTHKHLPKNLLLLLLCPYLMCSSLKHAMSNQRRDMICPWQTSISAAYSQFLHIYIWII